jgi:hypothetical protein
LCSGHIESSKGRLQDELLSGEIFDTLMVTMVFIQRWQCNYNYIRTHSASGEDVYNKFVRLYRAELGKSASGTNVKPGAIAGGGTAAK